MNATRPAGRAQPLGSILLVLLSAFVLSACKSHGASSPSPSPPATPEVSVNAKDGSQLVHVPAGPFTMGCDDGDADEAPAHQVDLKDYWIGRTLVTNRQYVDFLNDPARTQRVTNAERRMQRSLHAIRFNGRRCTVAPELAERPVTGVTWTMARAYCEWAGLRLPSEAEWEKAARGTDARKYPWGNDWDATRANGAHHENLGESEALDQVASMTSPVTAFPTGASPYGCLDMAGNVWEWCASLYAMYPYHSDDGREDPDGPGAHVVRGGAWSEHPTFLRCTNRFRGFSDFALMDWHNLPSTGFRVARSGTPETATPGAPPPEIHRLSHPQYQLLSSAQEGKSAQDLDEQYRLKPGPHQAGTTLGYPLSRERELKYFIPLEHLLGLSYWTRRNQEVVGMLRLQPGQVVADIGAGSGAVARLLAQAVGPTGQVWATDISISALKTMQKQPHQGKPEDDLYFFQNDPSWTEPPNTYYVLHDVTDCLLPPQSQDLAYLGWVHYFYYPRAEKGASPPRDQVVQFYRSIARSLKPDGRMAIYEFADEIHDRQRGLLKASEIVEQMRSAGFALISRHDLKKPASVLLIFKRGPP